MRRYERQVDDMYEDMTVEERIEAIDNIIRENIRGDISDEEREAVAQKIEEIRDSTPRDQLWDYNTQYFQYTHDFANEIIQLSRLVSLYYHAQYLKSEEMRLFYRLRDLAMLIFADNGDDEGIKEAALVSPEAFPPDEDAPKPSGLCWLVLTGLLEDVEKERLSDEERERVREIEEEMDALSDGEEEEWMELRKEKMELLPMTAEFEHFDDDSLLSHLHERQEEVFEEMKEVMEESDAVVEMDEERLELGKVRRYIEKLWGEKFSEV